MKSRKPLLLLLAGSALLAGCATGPYYDNYAYNERSTYYEPRTTYYDSYDYPTYRYYSYGPGYYVAPPSVSLGFSFGHRGRWR